MTDGTHVTAGQLALALTPYAQVTDLAVNTAAAGNRVTAELASKLDSSALAPAIAPLATAAALATTDGQVAAHGSSIAALQSSLTTGLSNKADQSAFDVLEGVVATKLSNYSTTAAMNGSIASANNATLATVAANCVRPPGHSGEDHAAGGGHQGGQRSPGGRHRRGAGLRARLQASKADAMQSTVDTSSEVDSKIAAALLNAVSTAALDAALLGKADASALASLLSTVDGLPLEVDTKIANALLGLATEAFVAAQLASRDAGITALHTPRTPRSPPARPRSRAPSTQSSRSLPLCSFPAAELLTRRPGRASQLGSSFAEAASFATCISWLLSLLRWPTATTR